MPRSGRPLVMWLALCGLVAGCLGSGGGEYARFQHRDRALAGNDRLLASVPRYPGAREARRDDGASEYKVGPSEYVWAAPYSTDVSYRLPGVGGERVLRLFERRLPAAGWRCGFQQRVRGTLRGFSCRRGHASLSGQIADRGGYGLSVEADVRVPPIHVVPGD